jgi:hypothetical protein
LEGFEMPKLVITHAVQNIDQWLAGKAEREALLGAAGRNVTDHVAMDGSNQAAVSLEVDDVAAVQAMIAAPPPEVAEAMQKHGVMPPLTIYVAK